MTGKIITYDGETYELPTLLSWKLHYTGGVPCDSFCVECLYSAAMLNILERAYRFRAVEEDGTTAFYGVVDEFSATYDTDGLLLRIEGRGMAALLLDNEAEATTYQRATVQEILKNHVLPYGIVCNNCDDGADVAEYTVESGASQWKALNGFAERSGLNVCFTASGALRLKCAESGQALVLGADAPICKAHYRARRYGVVSEVVVINRAKDIKRTVYNTEFRAKGGNCRRVVYAPARSINEMRYTGEYQIEKSAQGMHELVMLLVGEIKTKPRDRITLALKELGLNGTYLVAEIVRTNNARGETTELTLWEE